MTIAFVSKTMIEVTPSINQLKGCFIHFLAKRSVLLRPSVVWLASPSVCDYNNTTLALWLKIQKDVNMLRRTSGELKL
jgi:hypothetical protein